MDNALNKAELQALNMLAEGKSERDVYLTLGLNERQFQKFWSTIADKLDQFAPSTDAQYVGKSNYERVQRRKLESELWAAEARLNALMDVSPDAIFVIQGRSGRILRINNQVQVLLGYGPKELIGQSVEFLVDPSKREVHVAFRNAFLNNVRKREMGYHPPILVVKADGATIELDIALTATAATDDVMVICRPVLTLAQKPMASH